MIEKLVEQEGVKYAKKLGWKVYKASSPGKTGVHDQVHHKDGLTFYIEYKSTGKKASPKQRKFAQELKAAGIPCRCCDTVAKARGFIREMDFITGLWNLQSVYRLSQDISSFDP